MSRDEKVAELVRQLEVLGVSSIDDKPNVHAQVRRLLELANTRLHEIAHLKNDPRAHQKELERIISECARELGLDKF